MKITHHYKSIISATAALALFYSAAPGPEFLTAGKYSFTVWSLTRLRNGPAGGLPDQTWAVDTADARTANGQLVFDLRGKGSLPFLEGHLYEVAERGGPGFTFYLLQQ